MQRFIFALICLFCLQCSFAHAVNPASSLNWYQNYDQAVNASQVSGKPLVIFFTGSDWCVWCQRLDAEVLDTPEFAQSVKDQFIFLVLDFPRKPVDPQLLAQNKQLQNRFNVKSFPTIVILDSQQKLIGSVGYRAGGPRAYAEYLLGMIREFQSYRKSVDALHQQQAQVDVGQLKGLFGKAKELCRPDDIHTVLSAGLQVDDNRFFLLEKYRLLAEQGKVEQPEALAIKEKLLKIDPKNENLTQYEIAVINFECSLEKFEHENKPPEFVVAPLTSYIEQFGEQDKYNLWRLQILISQVFLENNQLSEALDYAKASHETAPSSVQADIETMIKNIESKLLTFAN